MIGYKWTVYHRHSGSGHDSDGIVASGITDKPGKAKSMVEMAMGTFDHAAWGMLLRVALDLSDPERVEHTADWPPAGEIQVCRRTTNGGLKWSPLYP